MGEKKRSYVIARFLVGVFSILSLLLAALELMSPKVAPRLPSAGAALALLPEELRPLSQGPCAKVERTASFLHASTEESRGMTAQSRRERDFACLGYLHALERSWQMDHFRRVALGMVSEHEGLQALSKDIQMRLLLLKEHAERLTAELSPGSLRLLQAYSAGVNGALQSPERIPDVRISPAMKEQPSGWRPVDSVALLLLQAFDQTRKGFIRELEEQSWVTQHGKEAGAWLNSDQMPWDISILKPGEYREQAPLKKRVKPVLGDPAKRETARWSAPGSKSNFHSRKDESFDEWGSDTRGGSNNWVISPSRSRSGRAWLANDPHLDLVDPPFWHPLSFDGVTFSATGFTFPGIPAFASGTNGEVAWGLTNSYLDVADLAAVSRGETQESELRTRWLFIPVRMGLFRIPVGPIPVQSYSDRLPILPVEVAGVPEDKRLALRWAGYHLEGKDIEAVLQLLDSKTAEDASERLSRLGLPSWNYVFADRSGAIGYRAVGKVPRRLAAPDVGIEVLGPGVRAREWDWKTIDFLSAQEMPHVLQPKRGYIVTANARQWPSNSVLQGGRAYSQGFRASRIEELLLQISQHDLETQRSMQCDIYASDARVFVPLLLDALLGEERDQAGEAIWREHSVRVRHAMERLMAWDYQTTPGCIACGIYRNWIVRLQTNLGGIEEPFLFRWLKGMIENSGELEGMMRSPAARGVLVASLEEALDELDQIAHRDSTDSAREGHFPKWESIHRAKFGHIGGQGREFSRQSIGTPGDENTVNPGSADWGPDGWDHRSGASMRMVVELSSPVKVWAVLAGPRAGDFSGADRSQAWESWRTCQLVQVR